MPGVVLSIAGEHDGVEILLFQGANGGNRVRFQRVGNDNLSQQQPVLCHQHLGAKFRTLEVGQLHVIFFQQLLVAAQHLVAVNGSSDALPSQLLQLGGGRDGEIRLLGGSDNAHGNGVGGILFAGGSQRQQLCLGGLLVCGDGFLHLEIALGDGAGFVHHHGLDLSQCLDGNAALEENALLGGGTDAGEEGQGYAEHQGAGAGNHQEGQGGKHRSSAAFAIEHGIHAGVLHRVNEVMPAGQHQGQHQCHHQSAQHHGRGINSGKTGDKLINGGLAGRCILHRIQDFCDHGFFQGLFYLHFQLAGGVDTAGDNLAARRNLHGHRLAGDGGGINAALALGHHAIQGNAVAGANQQDVAHLGIPGRDGFHLVAGHPVHCLGTQVNGGHNLAAALGYRPVFKVLADAEEQHDTHRLRVAANGKSTQGSNGHQEVFIKHLTLADVLGGSEQHLAAQNYIGRNQRQQLPHQGAAGQMQDFANGKQHRTDHQSGQLFLFILFLVSLLLLLGDDGDTILHGIDGGLYRGNQGIRILGSQAHLLGGEGDGAVLHPGQGA